MERKMSTEKMVLGAILTALVIVLQLVASIAGRFGFFTINLSLVPIVIGAATCGLGVGAWLGFVSGCVVLGMDSAAFLAVNPIATVVVVLAKGILCGVAAAWVFSLLKSKNIYVAVIAAAIVCPVVNTGIFFLGCMAFFVPFIEAKIAEMNFAGNAAQFVIFVFIGINFILEMLVNAVLSPIIVRVLKVRKA